MMIIMIGTVSAALPVMEGTQISDTEKIANALTN